ncbi:MAG: Bro-N domain-containing protein [Synergistaceae bacterium]|nr:Bro-N domain-containing protein [Synergistaceae bacterium]
MSNIQVYSNNNFCVRTTVDADGTVWFVGKDIAEALEYAEASNSARLFANIPEEWKGVKRFHTPGGEQNMLCLTEQGLYFFLGRSDKPKAFHIKSG